MVSQPGSYFLLALGCMARDVGSLLPGGISFDHFISTMSAGILYGNIASLL